ncbi:hypothetical protein ARAM_003213 [Aspergillus rambellii]|uniref:RNB domain-containing protein n=1 Tax=Aspergillus rambellii TaxID=308745 RepID=A0A0F8WRH1_9EURO|nr:hypothetical protein ARAM_003213 [Aspergillus rambellii]
MSYALKLRRSVTAVSAATSYYRPTLCTALHSAVGIPSSPNDLPRASIEDIRLRNEFEKNNDIRDYLRKWQEANPNLLDPIRDPSISNADKGQPWVGNMMNDNRDTYDAGDDNVRYVDDDASEFLEIAEEGEGLHNYLKPGDLVAISATDERLRFAVYVRSVQKQQQFYTERGKWRVAFPKELDYVIKGFVPPESINPLLPYFPDSLAEVSPELQSFIEGGVPRDVGAHLLRKMHGFNAEVQQLYRGNAVRFDQIHQIVAHEEEEMQFTLEELACRALEVEPDQLNDVILYTVHRAIRRNPFLMDKDGSSLFTNQYFVKPIRAAQMIETVTTWVHEHQNYLLRATSGQEVSDLKDHPLQKFIQKAQRLIRLTRKFRSPTTMASVGPTAQRFQAGQDGKPMVYREIPTERFNYNDRLIIQFLQSMCLPPKRMNSGAMRSTGSHIMRATGMYSALELNAASALLFLQELGVFSPWENLPLLDQDLALPGHGISSQSDSKWNDVEKVCEKLDGERLIDKMAGMRIDWGDLPVYCVDNLDAQEIDDGVSLERIPGSKDTFWIRIHIANPSAFIDSEDMLMKYAASRIQTLYAPEHTYPMLPPSLTQSHFSLAPGRPTLTFSAKMNLNGEVLDTNVSNGIVNNVIYMTHDTLRSMFDIDYKRPLKPLIVGGQSPNECSRTGIRDKLSPEDDDNFHILRKLMLAFREHRRKKGAMDWPSPIDTPISVSFGKEPWPPSTLAVDEGRYIVGDPIIQLQPQNIDPHEIRDQTKHNLISTLMNLGCWVSAKWCAERNIPAVYDGTYYHPEYPPLTSKNISEYGGDTWLQLGAPKGVSSSRPLTHIPLGLDPYVKSTSPLRRYSDLLVHQQIEAALRFEQETGRRLDATSPDGSVLPFSQEDIEDYISSSQWKRNRLRSCDRYSKQFWACMLLFRAFYFAECELPEKFQCLLHKPYLQTSTVGNSGRVFSGVISSLGVRCQLAIPAGMEDVKILSVVEGKITAVDMSRRMVSMEATRVVKHYERVGDWA